jgi:hypothetical protein
MRTIDLGKLSIALSNAAPHHGMSVMERDIDPYLLERIIMPYLYGQRILLADLDFTEFGAEEIDDALETISEVSGSANRTITMANAFKSIKPSAVKHKSFC